MFYKAFVFAFLSFVSSFQLFRNDKSTTSSHINLQVPSDNASLSVLYYDDLHELWEQNVIPPSGDGTSAFVSNNGLLCVDGPSREVEAALALKKAGVKGGLFNETFAQMSHSCSRLGFSYSGGVDSCSPGVMTYYRDQGAQAAFADSEKAALTNYSVFWNLDADDASLMAACTCEPGSAALGERTQSCENLNQHFKGSWVHHDYQTQEEEICDSGPFSFATFALAVLKSTAQLPMHQFDQIAPVDCAELGFPHRYDPPDHCFTYEQNTLHVHIRWPSILIGIDPGIQSSMETESDLFGGGFVEWGVQLGIDLSILFSSPGCHCLPGSEVGEQQAEQGLCSGTDHSPVEDWWYGQIPGANEVFLQNAVDKP